MKKDTLIAIYDALDGFGYEDKGVLAELAKEINKDIARKEALAQSYEEAHDAIIGALGKTPATCAEIYDAIKNTLPTGFGKGKVQYALTHLWEDEIEKIAGKPNTYRKA